MPKIVIREIDETTPGPIAESTDVVYIPGFVDVDRPELYNDDNEYVGIPQGVPTLFTSVSTFESLCGKCGATFDTAQQYTDLIAPIEGSPNFSGFNANAIPLEGTMFRAGSMDPSYVMAKELLNAGLNVLYERVNKGVDYVYVNSEPTDWSSTYTKYYYVPQVTLPNETEARKGNFELIKDNVAPKFYKVINPGTKYDEKTTYYRYEEIPQTLIKVQHKDIKKSGTGDEAKLADTYYIITKYYYTKNYKVLQPNEYTNKTWVQGLFYWDKPNNDETTTFSELDLQTFLRMRAGENATHIYEVVYDNAILSTNSSSTIRLNEWEVNYKNYYTFVEDAKTTIPEQESVPNFNSLGKVYEYKADNTIVTMYNRLPAIYNSANIYGLVDKGNFNFKYLTSGGYPVYEYNNNDIVNKMLTLAEARGDCVAIIDHTDNTDREDNIDLEGSLYYTVQNDDETFGQYGEYGTMFTPWAEYNRTTVDMKNSTEIHEACGATKFAASFAYLMALADSIKTNANWLAIAGSARGLVPNLTPDGMTTNIPNGAADAMQHRDKITINPITNIKPYGWTIWGNRTLKNNAPNGNLVATSFLNIRNLVSDVKKTVYRVARKLTFEQNNDVLWVNFKGLIAPTLDRMVSGYGISGYKIIRDTTHEKASEKATICAKVILYPVYAVEDFYITIVLKDDEVSVN